MGEEPAFAVSEFVAVLNQTLDYAYPTVTITGEIANFRVAKNRWVYFDLKDDEASLRCFGTVYQLPGPLEDGMMITVRAQPKLHPLYNFSLNIQAMQVTGEGSLKRAADLLAAKLKAEGLFDEDRKRSIPYPPERIGLITSNESAAYHDFLKVLQARWGGSSVSLANVQVQGEAAVQQIIQAIERCNLEDFDVIVLTRGGGSADDLAAFSAEPVVRAVAASRVPTLVAIGHEIDISLAELAADRRASTPSNAAELLVPDRREVIADIMQRVQQAGDSLVERMDAERQDILDTTDDMSALITQLIERGSDQLTADKRLLAALNPAAPLTRGFAIVYDEKGTVVRQSNGLKEGQTVTLRFADGRQEATIKS